MILYQNFIGFLLALLLLVFLPALPMAVALLFSLFVTLVADRYKFGNVINVLFYLLLFAGIFFLSFTISFSSSAGGRAAAEGEESLEALQTAYLGLYNSIKYMNPSLLLVDLAYTNNPLYLLLFVFGNILLAALVIFTTGLIVFFVINSETKNERIRIGININKRASGIFANIMLKKLFSLFSETATTIFLLFIL